MIQFLPGTEVTARGLRWEVVESQPLGAETRVRLRGTGAFNGFEIDVLTPFETLQPVVHELDPKRAGILSNWIVYHQAFLLEQALGPDAFLAVQPGRLRIEPYQLVPLMRALRMSRPRLLLADDVGLGKTIEAGLIIAELMARRRVHRLLIVTPAGPLLEQWQIEMSERFGLRLEHANRDAIDRIRRATELGANPFDHLSLGVASMDYLKQDRVLDELERALPYDLVVIDEAHHYAETGANQSDTAESSQRRRLGQVLAQRSDALVLLSATPHDGYERSFASLLELLDPSLVDGKGGSRSEAYRPHVVRRLKKHVRVTHPETGELVSFPERQLIPIAITASETKYSAFVDLHERLLAFIAPELRRALRLRRYDDALAYLALLKRSTSSVTALRNTLQAVHERMTELASSKVEEIEAQSQRRKSLKALQRKMARFGTLTLDEEAERELLEREELAQQLVLLDRETRRSSLEVERRQTAASALADLLGLAEMALERDAKLDRVLAEVRAIRDDEPQANILVYTEYIDSLKALERRLKAEQLGPVLTIHGASNDQDETTGRKLDRRAVTDRFRTRERQILISTDAAAEGLNLHERCHHLIHLELPWNPNRLEQRNGRIDRYGQWHTPIIRYLYLCGTFEERILARLMAKYERQRMRLHFVPNTLGLDVLDLPEEGLFKLLTSGDNNLRTPCDRNPFDAAADDADDSASQALLQEIESTLNRFENVARTHRWLGDEGAAADAISQGQAQRAFATGRTVGEVSLADFVEGAVLAEGGKVEQPGSWLDIYPPRTWAYGLEGLPGWDEGRGRLRLTLELNRLTDENGEPVGYLGRAHPLVRRAIDHVRHVALGQDGGLDHRVAAAQSQDGQPGLLFTFLGRVNSGAGREFERVVAVRVTRDLAAEVKTETQEWLPAPADGVATRNLWEKKFMGWGKAAEDAALAAATATFYDLAADFEAAYMRLIEGERRELEQWFESRVSELVRETEVDLPLFSGMLGGAQGPLERLQMFLGQAGKRDRQRQTAEDILALYRQRVNELQQRATITEPTVLQLGMIMETGVEA